MHVKVREAEFSAFCQVRSHTEGEVESVTSKSVGSTHIHTQAHTLTLPVPSSVIQDGPDIPLDGNSLGWDLWDQGFGLQPGPYEEEGSMNDAELGCCRRAVQHRVSAAAAVQSSGGTLLHEYPDFILPFIIQSLAHHPDFPTQEVQHHPHMFLQDKDLYCHHIM